MGFYRGPNIVRDGLVLALDAGAVRSYPGSGTTVYNLADGTYNGTLVNGMTYDSEASGCFVGDGTDDNITFGESADTKGTTNNAITYECWVKRTGTSTASNPRIMSTDASDYNALYLESSGAGNLIWRINIGGGSKTVTHTGGVPLNEWTHIIGTGYYNGSSNYTAELYINGSLVGNNNAAASGAWGDGTSRPFAIFSNVESTVQNNNCLTGKVASARVYNISLTADQVTQNYNAQKSRFGL